jgi:hypothetical protein
MINNISSHSLADLFFFMQSKLGGKCKNCETKESTTCSETIGHIRILWHVDTLLGNDREIGEWTTMLRNPFLGNGLVNTFPQQRIRTQQWIYCWKRCFLLDPYKRVIRKNWVDTVGWNLSSAREAEKRWWCGDIVQLTVQLWDIRRRVTTWAQKLNNLHCQKPLPGNGWWRHSRPE